MRLMTGTHSAHWRCAGGVCCAGDPFTCAYKTVFGYPATDICVDYWYTLQPGEKQYFADTGYSGWDYTARVQDNPGATWGSGAYRDLTYQPCTHGDEGCYGWDEVRIASLHASHACMTGHRKAWQPWLMPNRRRNA